MGPSKELVLLQQKQFLSTYIDHFLPFCSHFLLPLLFLGEGPFPEIIDLFGSIGDLVGFWVSLLAARGFAVLALTYFVYEDLPNKLLEVDLEYFEEAANFLLAHPKVVKILFILSCSTTEKKSQVPAVLLIYEDLGIAELTFK